MLAVDSGGGPPIVAFDADVGAADAMFFLAGSTLLLMAAYGIEREARRARLPPGP